jgi:myo-inositol 2-dehydrogenase / D-chiro-inositol 1-dehydrogenase
MTTLNRDAALRTPRRSFLKASAVLGAAGLAGGLSPARAVHAGASDILRIGLIGCGGRGSGAAVNAMNVDKNAKLVALADAFADQVQSSLQRLKKAKPDQVAVDADHCFSGFDAYQQLIQSGVDVVLLATPPHFRPIHLAACVAAGKHVFCEKPMAVDAPGVRAVLTTAEEAKKKGLSIVAGLCCRHDLATRETMQRVQDGAIGQIVAIQENYNSNPPWFRNKTRESQWTEMEYQMRNWYPFTWLSGDHNVEQHVHSLDKACWALGDTPPLKAWGMGGRQVRSDITIGHIFDHHAVCYQYANGVRLFSYCRRQAGCFNETSDIILGAKGRAFMPQRCHIEGENPWEYQGTRVRANMYDAEHEVLFQAIRSGTPRNDGSYMTLSTMLAILGRMVTYTGKEITWEQAMNSKEKLAPTRYAWDADPPCMPDEHGQYPLAVPGVTPFV